MGRDVDHDIWIEWDGHKDSCMEVQTPHGKEHFEGYAPDNIRSKSKVGQSPQRGVICSLQCFRLAAATSVPRKISPGDAT